MISKANAPNGRIYITARIQYSTYHRHMPCIACVMQSRPSRPVSDVDVPNFRLQQLNTLNGPLSSCHVERSPPVLVPRVHVCLDQKLNIQLEIELLPDGRAAPQLP